MVIHGESISGSTLSCHFNVLDWLKLPSKLFKLLSFIAVGLLCLTKSDSTNCTAFQTTEYALMFGMLFHALTLQPFFTCLICEGRDWKVAQDRQTASAGQLPQLKKLMRMAKELEPS